MLQVSANVVCAVSAEVLERVEQLLLIGGQRQALGKLVVAAVHAVGGLGVAGEVDELEALHAAGWALASSMR